MNDLIRVENREGAEYVDARGLYSALEVSRDFSTWIKDRIEKYGFQEGKDFSPIPGESTGGRPAIEYFLSVSMAKELATVENNEKGREVRRYLIQVEEAWNSPEMVMERARQASEILLARMRARLAIVEPKAAFADAIDSTTSGIPMGDFAHILAGKGWDIGRIRLSRALKEHGIIYSEFLPGLNKRVLHPYQNHIEAGRFAVNEVPVEAMDSIYPQILITPKGQRYILNHLESWGFTRPDRKAS